MGAKATGVDFSDKAIEQAKELANRLNLDTRFICCDVYSLPDHLDEQFDLVFTSYGTIGWLPDLDQWAFVVSRYLKPGGRFVFVEFHPVVWMFDDDLQKITYSYFNTDVIQDEEVGTYADRDSEEQHQFICWNHPLDEVFNSLKNAGLTWESFREYDYSPYGFLSCCEQVGEREYIIKHLGRKLPLVYSLTCSKS
jgi:ubiquinone/menaquinone biosynthesis C-methylase UbiE